MPFKLHVLRRAYSDIDEKFESLRRHRGCQAAVRWRDRLEAKFSDLEQHPAIWPLADEASELGMELREALFGRRRHVYRILYTFDGSTVSIHRVRHAAQDRLAPDDV